MKVAGEAVLNAPVDKVWDALLDPRVLVRTIPGCERLEATGENAYAMTITTGVASIKGTYAGTCELRDLRPHQSLVLKAAGSGAPGTVSADVAVGFNDAGDGTTRLTYDADAVVGGMVGGVGQRMLTSVSKRMAGEFFGSVDEVLTGGAPREQPKAASSEAVSPEAESPEAVSPEAVWPRGAATAGQTYTAPRPAAGAPDQFVKGVLLGAGLVLAGVVVGGLFGRRRS